MGLDHFRHLAGPRHQGPLLLLDPPAPQKLSQALEFPVPFALDCSYHTMFHGQHLPHPLGLIQTLKHHQSTLVGRAGDAVGVVRHQTVFPGKPGHGGVNLGVTPGALHEDDQPMLIQAPPNSTKRLLDGLHRPCDHPFDGPLVPGTDPHGNDLDPRKLQLLQDPFEEGRSTLATFGQQDLQAGKGDLQGNPRHARPGTQIQERRRKLQDLARQDRVHVQFLDHVGEIADSTEI